MFPGRRNERPGPKQQVMAVESHPQSIQQTGTGWMRMDLEWLRLPWLGAVRYSASESGFPGTLPKAPPHPAQRFLPPLLGSLFPLTSYSFSWF